MSDSTQIETIRDLREQKRLGQWTVAQACGLGFSAYTRIEAGSGKTTPEEVASVLKVLREMPEGTRKLGGGRPHNDPAKRAAVAAARAEGRSVAEALAQASGAAAEPQPAAAPEIASQDVEDTGSDEPAPGGIVPEQVEGFEPEVEGEDKKAREARKARNRRRVKKAEADAAAAASGLL